MIRLAIATGFMAVFGIVAYAVVLLLKDYFNKKSQSNEKETTKN